MIKYALICENRHSFEAWFADSLGFDAQKSAGLIECPYCASKNIEKAIMAPNIQTSKSQKSKPELGDSNLLPPELVGALKDIKEHIAKNYDYVGKNFAQEARAIHEGESEERLIYGESTKQEVIELIEDGVPIAPLPPLANPKGDKDLN